MSTPVSPSSQKAREYYNSTDADNFYYHIWGGTDIHVGLYENESDPIHVASDRTVQKMMSMVDIKPGAVVADLGSGYGGTARRLAKTFGCQVKCINIAEIQNERNRRANEQEGLTSQIEVLDASFESIPLPNSSCDIVWSQDSIDHSAVKATVISEITRILKPGGTLIFTDLMAADDAPADALEHIVKRIHLTSMGSVEYYCDLAKLNGLKEVNILRMSDDAGKHYTRVRDDLISRRSELKQKISVEYLDNMTDGLVDWIDGYKQGHLAWGIMIFKKPAENESSSTKAREYYNSSDADNFYYHIWGGTDIHVGLYENENDSIYTASDRTVQKMMSMVDIKPGAVVADLGSGYGGTARRLAKTFGCQVKCINISDVQNKRNREANEKEGLSSQIEVLDASFESTPLPNGSVDVAWSQDSFLHSDKKGVVFGEIVRVLKPGGTLIFTDPMAADDAPHQALASVFQRIHLNDMGSFKLYRHLAAQHGLVELDVLPFNEQVRSHYSKVRANLRARWNDLKGDISAEYLEGMVSGLGHWINAAEANHLAWGILKFKKPE